MTSPMLTDAAKVAAGETIHMELVPTSSKKRPSYRAADLALRAFLAAQNRDELAVRVRYALRDHPISTHDTEARARAVVDALLGEALA